MRAYAAFAVLTAACALLVAGAVLTGDAAFAQASRSETKKPAAPSRPAWKDLTPNQREALAPLADDWDSLDEARKRKWLEVAPKYHQLSPEGQQRMHSRMKEFARLTPEQRWTARENFQRAYELPADQRNSLIQQYKELPPERKQQLNERATRRPESARREAGPQGAPRPSGSKDSATTGPARSDDSRK